MEIAEFMTLAVTGLLAIAGFLAVYVLNSIKGEIRDIKTSLAGLEKDMRGVVAGLEKDMNISLASLDRRVTEIEAFHQFQANERRREGQ